MSKLDNLYQSPVMMKLQEWGGKLQANKALSAISGGMMAAMAVILAGAIFTVVATLLDIVGVLETTDAAYMWLTTPYNMTMGILGVVVAFAVGYIYSKNLEMEGALANGIVTMILFLLVCAPVQSVTLQDGSTMSVLATTYLGGTGLFTALIIPLVSVKIIDFCQKHHVSLKMPDAVPQFLSDAFATLVPLVICILLWHGLNTLAQMTIGVVLPGAIAGILSIPLTPLMSVPGMFVLAFVCQLLWSLGIHGAMVLSPVIMAPMIQFYTQNAELVASGQAAMFAPIALYGVMSCCGGSGNVPPLAVLCMRSKSEQLRAVGKAGIVPAVFNISEPMAFGTPIIYNPIMAIPFILNPMIIMFFAYIGYSLDFFQPGHLLIMTQLPIIMQSFMPSLAWQNLFIAPMAFVIAFLVYLPFVKVYDHQLCEKEAAEKAASEA